MTTVVNCTDPSLGKLLHEYEMGLLGEDEKQAFEQHLIACESCFDDAEAMRQPMGLFRSNASLRQSLQPSETEARMEDSFFKRLGLYLWPSGSFWSKPAVSMALLCLVVALSAGELLRTPSPKEARAAVMLGLSDTRAAGINEITLSRSEDLVLSFSFLSGSPDSRYEVAVVNSNGDVIYTTSDFRFDRQLIGRLVLDSRRLESGRYTLTINDPNDSSPLGADTVAFQVSLVD